MIFLRALRSDMRSTEPAFFYITLCFLMFVVWRSAEVCKVTFLWTVLRIGSMTSYLDHSLYFARSAAVSSSRDSVKFLVILSILWRGTGGILL